MDEWEIKIVKYFNQLGSNRLDGFLRFINSIIFLVFFWTTLVAMAVISHPNIAKEFLMSVFVVAILHFVITEGLIKHLLTRFFSVRPRPYVAYPDLIRPIGQRFSDSSFPSSHVATTTAMLVVISRFYPSLFFPAVILIFIMAFSRLHNGMHYPSDIIAGMLFGIFYGYAAIELVKLFF